MSNPRTKHKKASKFDVIGKLGTKGAYVLPVKNIGRANGTIGETNKKLGIIDHAIQKIPGLRQGIRLAGRLPN